jgi:hypothetical protein
MQKHISQSEKYMKSGNERSIQSLDRAFDILHVIGQSDAKGLSLKEIC